MKSKKKVIYPIVLILVLVGVFNLVAFVLPFTHSRIFWTSYIFGWIAIAMALLIFAVSSGKDGSAKSRFYGFPIAEVGLIYLVIQLILSFIGMAMAGITGIPHWPFIVVFALALAAAVVGFITKDTTRDEVELLDEKVRRSISGMRELRTLGTMLTEKCRDPEAKAALGKLSDALRFSDPVSSAGTRNADAVLKGYMDELSAAVDAGDKKQILDLCGKAQDALSERNRLAKLSKN